MFRPMWILCTCLAMSIPATVGPAFAESQVSVGLGSTQIDEFGSVPTLDLGYQNWTPDGPGVDLRAGSFLLLSTVDLGVIRSMGQQVRVTPRLGPSLLVIGIGPAAVPGVAGGIQFALPAGRGHGVAVDFSLRAYGIDRRQPLFPMASVGVSYYWSS